MLISKPMKQNPTNELYAALRTLYTHFNQHLFDNKLPEILFTNQRQTGVMGYFAPNRWISINGNKCHEIAINPLYVGKSSLLELMQTLVHEMVHCWQHCYGKPSRHGYHNKQWANKMINIGLIPSSTGKPGGAITGQKMNDYPASTGKFLNSCATLIKNNNFKLPWVDRYATTTNIAANISQLFNGYIDDTINLDETPEEVIDDSIKEQLCTPLTISFDINQFIPPKLSDNKIKVKYSCSGCKLNVWGKRGLNLKCNDCNLDLLAII